MRPHCLIHAGPAELAYVSAAQARAYGFPAASLLNCACRLEKGFSRKGKRIKAALTEYPLFRIVVGHELFMELLSVLN